jgi:HAD superfamily hydrolase (TIGR01484 family)
VKLIFIDLDGTLRHTDGTISAATIDAIKNVQNHDYMCVLCTGRNKDYAARIRREIGAGKYVCFSSGAGVYDCDDWRVLHVNPLKHEAIHAVTDVALKFNNTYLDIHPFAAQVGIQCYDLENTLQIGELLKKIPNICVCNKHKALDDPKFANGKAYYYDIVDEKTDKGYGVRVLREMLGVSKDDCIAIGDGENDIPMLRECARAVAMGNSVAALKPFATEFIDTNNNDGVAQFLNKLVKSVDKKTKKGK